MLAIGSIRFFPNCKSVGTLGNGIAAATPMGDMHAGAFFETVPLRKVSHYGVQARNESQSFTHPLRSPRPREWETVLFKYRVK